MKHDIVYTCAKWYLTLIKSHATNVVQIYSFKTVQEMYDMPVCTGNEGSKISPTCVEFRKGIVKKM